MLIIVKGELHRYLCIAFMFSGGQLPTSCIPSIVTRICMVYSDIEDKTSHTRARVGPELLGTLVSGTTGVSVQYILKD